MKKPTHGESITIARTELSNLSEKILKNFVGPGKKASDLFSTEWQRRVTAVARSYLAIRFHETFILGKPKPVLDKHPFDAWFSFPLGTDDFIRQFIRNNEISIRRNLFLNFMFEFEQFLKIMNSKLPKPLINPKYQDLAKKILKELKVKE